MEKPQFSMVLANKKGELARLGEVLGQAQVNIEALSISDGVHTGVLKLVVDDPDRARAAFQEAGLSFTEQRVVAISLPNHPGALAEICSKLAAEGHSINCVYGSTCEGGDCRSRLMLSVADVEALAALQDVGWWPGPG